MPRGQALGITFQLPEADKGKTSLTCDTTRADSRKTRTLGRSTTP